MKTLLGFLLALVLVTSGCQTTDGEYDPVRNEQVTSAVKALVSTPISVLLIQGREKDQEKAMVRAAYFRSIGSAMCELERLKTFDPMVLQDKIDLIFKDLVKDDIEVLLAKNTIVTVYRGFFNSRAYAELPEESFMMHVLDVFCDGIGRGLVDGGFEGITPAP